MERADQTTPDDQRTIEVDRLAQSNDIDYLQTDGRRHVPRAHQSPIIRRKPEWTPGSGGCAVIATRPELHPAVDDAEIQAVDQAAITTLLAEVPHSRSRPLAVRNGVVAHPLAHHAAIPQ